MRQRLQTELVLDVSRFGRFGAEKFSPRWHIVKQRTNLDLCPGRFAAVAHRLDPPAVYQNFCAGDREKTSIFLTSQDILTVRDLTFAAPQSVALPGIIAITI